MGGKPRKKPQGLGTGALTIGVAGTTHPRETELERQARMSAALLRKEDEMLEMKDEDGNVVAILHYSGGNY